MTFEEAAQRYQQLQQACAAGQIPASDFEAQVEQLVVADPAGTWWRPDARSGQWLTWDGAAWLPASASGASPEAAQRSQPPAATAGGIAPLPTTGKLSQRIGDIIAIAGSVALAGGLYYYSTLDKGAAPDQSTPVLMVLIPILLIALRKPIDSILRPVQPLRNRIPRLVLVGAGIAIPFLVASALYPKYTQYEYLKRSYVFSTLLSYAVLRTPAAPASRRAPAV